MHFISILRHKHTSTQTPSSKPANAFSVIPLGIFTIVSTMPNNALTFEKHLAHTPVRQFISYTTTPAESTPASIASPTVSAIAPSNPVTIVAPRPKNPNPQLPVNEIKPVPIVIAPAVKPAPKPIPAPVAAPVPQGGATLVLQGEASYYSRAGCLGCSASLTMANGQPLNDNALTMAIGADKKHFVGRKAKVTNLVTGKSVVVTITDTGGFYKAKYGNRVADLTIATKQAIGMNGGVGQVRVEVF